MSCDSGDEVRENITKRVNGPESTWEINRLSDVYDSIESICNIYSHAGGQASAVVASAGQSVDLTPPLDHWVRHIETRPLT